MRQRCSRRAADIVPDRPSHHRRAHFEARPAVYAPVSVSLDPRSSEALRGRGIQQLTRTARAFGDRRQGEHVVVVTPTASGKTLCYNLPCSRPSSSSQSRVLYLFPTKALARTARELTELAKSLPTCACNTYTATLRRRPVARCARGPTSCSPIPTCSTPHPAHHTKWREPLPESPLRRDRRAARVSRRLRSHLANVAEAAHAICRHYGRPRSSSWPRPPSPILASSRSA